MTLSRLERFAPFLTHKDDRPAITNPSDPFATFHVRRYDFGNTQEWFTYVKPAYGDTSSNPEDHLVTLAELYPDDYEIYSHDKGHETPAQRLLHDCKIAPFSWVRIEDFTVGLSNPNYFQAHTDTQYRTVAQSIATFDCDVFAPLRVLCLDIESYSPDGTFPDAKRRDMPIIGIGHATYILGQDAYHDLRYIGYTAKHATDHKVEETQTASWGKKEEPYHIEMFGRETEMLVRQAAYIQEMDPDIVMTFNGNGYDYPAILDKYEMYGLTVDYARMHIGAVASNKYTRELVRYTVNGKRKKKKNVANDRPKYYRVSMKGRVDYDYYRFCNSTHPMCQLSSQSLDALATHYLGGVTKDDLPPSAIFRAHDRGDFRSIAHYCVKDCILPIEIARRKLHFHAICNASRICTILPQVYLISGQYKRLVTRLKSTAIQEGLAWFGQTFGGYDDEDPEKYQGAMVLVPTPGYFNVPIFVLDFAGLYPSVIRWKNIGPDTEITPEYAATLPPEDYIIMDCGKRTHYFLAEHRRKGLFSIVLEEVLGQRKVYKRKMAQAARDGDAVMEATYDQMQLAFKLVANSMYGIFKMVHHAAAESTTAGGRMMIRETRKYCEQHVSKHFDVDLPEHLMYFPQGKGTFYVRVIYGDTDSVFIQCIPMPGSTIATSDYANVAFMTEFVDLIKTLGDHITKYVFGSPYVELEYEKYYWPFFINKKKRYAGMRVMYPKEGVSPTLNLMGIDVKRRDAIPFAVRVGSELLRRVLDVNESFDTLLEFIRLEGHKILCDELPIEDYVMSIKLQAESAYESPDTEIAVNVARQMKARGGDRHPPAPGDRIRFVIKAPIESVPGPGSKKTKRIIAHSADDPEYVKAMHIPVDLKHYHSHFMDKCAPLLAIKLTLEEAGERLRDRYRYQSEQKLVARHHVSNRHERLNKLLAQCNRQTATGDDEIDYVRDDKVREAAVEVYDHMATCIVEMLKTSGTKPLPPKRPPGILSFLKARTKRPASVAEANEAQASSSKHPIGSPGEC